MLLLGALSRSCASYAAALRFAHCFARTVCVCVCAEFFRLYLRARWRYCACGKICRLSPMGMFCKSSPGR